MPPELAERPMAMTPEHWPEHAHHFLLLPTHSRSVGGSDSCPATFGETRRTATRTQSLPERSADLLDDRGPGRTMIMTPARAHPWLGSTATHERR
jgi:hypothetical protein